MEKARAMSTNFEYRESTEERDVPRVSVGKRLCTWEGLTTLGVEESNHTTNKLSYFFWTRLPSG